VAAGREPDDDMATVCVTSGPAPLNSAPQDKQNRLDAGTSFEQLGQITRVPLG
jgi:hypothetical protein